MKYIFCILSKCFLKYNLHNFYLMYNKRKVLYNVARALNVSCDYILCGQELSLKRIVDKKLPVERPPYFTIRK